MIHDKKKLAKIVEELTIFFFSVGATEIDSHIQHLGKDAVLNFSANYDPKHHHKLESAHKLLNSERDDGMEDVFWELVGAGDPGEGSQLLLIGMMIDRADVTIKETTADITIYKKLS